MLDFSRTWLPFLYLYGVGGIAFIVGMMLILKTKALNKEIAHHRIWLKVLYFGFGFYATLHAAFILLALGSS